MTSCDLQQIAIERRLHGDLGPAEAASLDVHLQSCQSCRAYQATARGVEAAMAEQATEAVRGVDWEAVRRGVERHRRWWAGELASTLLGLTGALAVTAALVPARHRGAGLAVMGGACLLLAGVTVARARRRLRELAPPAAPVELLAQQRLGIQRDLRSWRRQLGVYALLPAALLATVVLHWPDLSALPYLLGLSGVVGALAAYDLLVRLPRARRELADLEPRSSP